MTCDFFFVVASVGVGGWMDGLMDEGKRREERKGRGLRMAGNGDV